MSDEGLARRVPPQGWMLVVLRDPAHPAPPFTLGFFPSWQPYDFAAWGPGWHIDDFVRYHFAPIEDEL
jgi:hypothetical protein